MDVPSPAQMRAEAAARGLVADAGAESALIFDLEEGWEASAGHTSSRTMVGPQEPLPLVVDWRRMERRKTESGFELRCPAEIEVDGRRRPWTQVLRFEAHGAAHVSESPSGGLLVNAMVGDLFLSAVFPPGTRSEVAAAAVNAALDALEE